MWGSLPEWISALGAIGALTAAIWAAVTSKRLFEIESSRDQIAAQRIAREQASQISAWCVALLDEHGKWAGRGILIHNSSNAPVYDLEVDSTYAAKSTDAPQVQNTFRMGIVPPGDFVTTASNDFDKWTFPDAREEIPYTVRPVTKNKAWSVGVVRFTDAHGAPWARAGGYLGTP